jgi:hypothetical protein
MFESLTSSMLSNARDVSHPDPGLAVDLALRAVIGVLRDEDEAGPPEGMAAAVRDRELVRMIQVYLGSAPAGPAPAPDVAPDTVVVPADASPDRAASEPAPKGVDYFDVWG